MFTFLTFGIKNVELDNCRSCLQSTLNIYCDYSQASYEATVLLFLSGFKVINITMDISDNDIKRVRVSMCSMSLG